MNGIARIAEESRGGEDKRGEKRKVKDRERELGRRGKKK